MEGKGEERCSKRDFWIFIYPMVINYNNAYINVVLIMILIKGLQLIYKIVLNIKVKTNFWYKLRNFLSEKITDFR